jgi:hypothetical protein
MAGIVAIEIGQVRVCSQGIGIYEIVQHVDKGIMAGAYIVKWFHDREREKYYPEVIWRDRAIPNTLVELYRVVYG